MLVLETPHADRGLLEGAELLPLLTNGCGKGTSQCISHNYILPALD
jgi:hypothetical protein